MGANVPQSERFPDAEQKNGLIPVGVSPLINPLNNGLFSQ
jgi:hypothetical protein